jgi:hypothetical protein
MHLCRCPTQGKTARQKDVLTLAVATRFVIERAFSVDCSPVVALQFLRSVSPIFDELLVDNFAYVILVRYAIYMKISLASISTESGMRSVQTYALS